MGKGGGGAPRSASYDVGLGGHEAEVLHACHFEAMARLEQRRRKGREQAPSILSKTVHCCYQLRRRRLGFRLRPASGGNLT